MNYDKVRTLLIGTLVIVGLLFVFFVFIIRKLRHDMEKNKTVEPDDVFYQNLKTALEKQHALNMEVQRREKFQKTILDNISVGVAVLDKYKKFKEVNNFFKQLFRIQNDITGKTLVDSGLPNDFVSFVKDINFSMLFSPFEKQVRTGDKVLLVRVSKINYLEDAEGILLLIHDITEIENAKKKLELKNRLEYIGEMSANMAHEFKNSISTVKGYGQMILAALKDKEEKARKYAERILNESESINEVVNRFLLYAKPLDISPEKIKVSEFVEELSNLFENESVLVFSVKNDFVFEGDRLLLRQCFANLIRNALEGVKDIENPVVEVIVEKRQGEVLFRVKDNGKGIEKEEASRVFVPFFTTKSEGTGLGLPICEKIIAKHNGSIEIKSEKGKGTEVIVRL